MHDPITVSELIASLNKIKDKSKTVLINCSYNYYDIINLVQEGDVVKIFTVHSSKRDDEDFEPPKRTV